MRVELRQNKVGEEILNRVVLICETERESEILNLIYGDKVIDKDGLIGVKECECRLSDGYGEHYLHISDRSALKNKP